MRKPTIVAFMNAYSQGKSGGDMVFIEVAKRTISYGKIIVTSQLGKELCQKNGVRGKYLITSNESEFGNVIWTYFKRTVKAFFLKLNLRGSDVLLGTSDFLPDVLPILWLKIKNPKIKWVQHIFHLISPSRKIPYSSQRISFYLIKKWADLVIVDNTLLKKDLIGLGFNGKKMEVNYPGINIEHLETVKPASNGYDGVFMAQLRLAKGVFDLVKIWKLVKSRLPNAKLGIIGRGSKEILKKLKEEIKKEKLEKNIEIIGYLEDAKAFSTIKASKVFVFPSHEEGFGIAALEAQVLGLPVVAWNLPVFEEIFPKGMIKLKIGKVKKFAEEVVRLLREKKFYQSLSQEAVKNAKRFNWDKTAKRELKLIRELIK